MAVQFGANLKRIRRQAGVSQEELAHKAGLHRTEIGLLERGERTAKITTLAKLCAGLDTEPNELLDGIRWHIGQVHTGGFKLKARKSS